jgi:uncharacterized protein (TIGR02117 family)
VASLWSALQNEARATLLVLLLACACAGPIADLQFRGQGEKARRVFIVNHGWHSAIVIGKADIPEGLLPEIRDFPDADYLEIGWGDRDYYQAPDPGLGSALKAAFWSSGSVLHVAAFKGAVENYFLGSEIVDIDLPDQAFQLLIQFISDTFSRSDPALPDETRPGLYGNSRFYAARARFHLFRTCNTWVAEALRSTGLPISPAYAITAGNLMYQVKQCCSVKKMEKVGSGFYNFTILPTHQDRLDDI